MFFRQRHGIRYEAEQIDQIIPGSKSTYYLFRILGGLAVMGVFSLLGGGLFGLGGDDEVELRPVLQLAGSALVLQGDGVELLKRLGGTSCLAREGNTERWIFRVRPDTRETDGQCEAMPGDLLVWVEGRTITAFQPVFDEAVVRDAAGFATYQRRFTGGRPPSAPR